MNFNESIYGVSGPFQMGPTSFKMGQLNQYGTCTFINTPQPTINAGQAERGGCRAGQCSERDEKHG